MSTVYKDNRALESLSLSIIVNSLLLCFIIHYTAVTLQTCCLYKMLRFLTVLY